MNPDILIPFAFENKWRERIKPALEALGVRVDNSLLQMLGSPTEATIWPLRIRRPRPGGVLVPIRQGKNYRAGDATVRFPEDKRWESRDGLTGIDSVYGMSAQASSTQPGAKEQVEWEEHPLLAVSTDFITIVADILPGKDAFVGVEIWANSMLPVAVMAQNPLGFTSEIKVNAFRNLNKDDVELKSICLKCSGSGSIQCKKCQGTGQWQMQGSCKKCYGSGGWSCKKCDGSGAFIGKYGDRMGDCGRCSGTGRQSCFVCKGSGEPPILSCDACSGTGAESCYPCSGEGKVWVGFNIGKGVFFWHDTDLASEDVQAVDCHTNGDYVLFQGASAILAQLTEEAAAVKSRQAVVVATQAEIAKVGQCLDLAMEAQGVTSALLDFRPLHLGSVDASIHRAKKRLILRFSIPKSPPWAKTGELPFPVATPLRLTSDGEGRNEIELKRVGNDRLKSPVDPLFHGLETIEKRAHLLISFPEDIDRDCLLGENWVKPDIIPPSERAQQKELGRWCDRAEAPRLIESFSIITSSSLPAKPRPIKALAPQIRSNPRQQEALDWIMSGVPLVLVKGPPGTGKTTVITEVALQSVAKSEKVLVCSETHQAVANVLEKLHKNGRVRMIRHARSENPKLTKLEREYLEDGSQQGFLREVRERLAQQVKVHEELRNALTPLPSLIDAAQRTATELMSFRTILGQRGQKAQKEFTKCGQSATKSKEARRKKAEDEQATAIAVIEVERARLQKTLDRTTKVREKAQTEREKTKVAFTKKTGREPDSQGLRPSPLRRIFGLVPNMFATHKLLNERFCEAQEIVAEAASEIAGLQKDMSENEQHEAECRQRTEKAIQEAETEASRAMKQAEVELNSELEAVATGLRKAEVEFLPAQASAAATCNASGKFGRCANDESPDLWRQLLAECSEKIERNAEELDFCLRWQKATESSTKELSSLFWDTTQVFLSTCVGLASWRSFASHFGKEGVDLVIIDEAAHATLTQTLIPLGKAKRAVLIGDEMQLPPAPPMELANRCEQTCEARCHESTGQTETLHRFKPPMSQCWLERSAFEWIAETRPWVPKIMLNRQFRMHPDIADFVADVFYEGGLENGVTAKDRHLVFGDFTKAVCIVSTSAYEDRFEEKPSPQATSLRNPLEVELTRRILKQALGDLGQKTSFGVVTPYEAQKTLMQSELADLFGSAGKLDFEREDIASVDSFQGSERDVMIASFVRSPRQQPTKCKKCGGSGSVKAVACESCQGRGWLGPSLTWVHDLRRLNVAFSRARKMLILVGDVEALTNPHFGTEAGTEVLKRFRDHVADRGRVLHVWEEKQHE